MEFKENEVKRTESIKIRLTPGERARLDEIKARPELARWIREEEVMWLNIRCRLN